MLTTAQAAQRAGVRPVTIRSWIKAGLPSTKAGRDHFIREADLDVFLTQKRGPGRPQKEG